MLFPADAPSPTHDVPYTIFLRYALRLAAIFRATPAQPAPRLPCYHERQAARGDISALPDPRSIYARRDASLRASR